MKVKKKLLEKLNEFKKPILTIIDEQEKPFSIPIEYSVQQNKQDTTFKLEIPTHVKQSASTSKANLLFRSFTALTQGGYGNRKYMLFKGELTKNTFTVTSVNAWDESETDFMSLVQQSLPNGITYMKRFNKELYQKTMKENRQGRLVTAVSGIPLITPIKYYKDEHDNMYFFAHFTHPSIRQLDLNPEVKVLLSPPHEYKIDTDIEIHAHASFVTEKTQVKELIEHLRDLYPGIDTAFQFLQSTARIIKLTPYRMTYGAKTKLETYDLPTAKENLLKDSITAITRKIKYWAFASRAPFFTAIIVPILVGGASAYYATHTFNWALFLLTLLGGIIFQAGANIINDYFDYTSGNDEFNSLFSPFNGGSRFIQSGLIRPEESFLAGTTLFIIGIAIGLYLNAMTPGNVILIIGVIGAGLAFFYTAGPIRISYLGLGDIAVFLSFGPLPILGTFYVQTGTLDFNTAKTAIFASIPVGILVSLILFINSFQDMDADALAHKNTSIVRLGKQRAVKVYIALLILAYLSVLIAVIFGYLPVLSILVFLTLPLAWNAIKTIQSLYTKIYELLPVNTATIGTHLTFGVLLALGILINAFIVIHL